MKLFAIEIFRDFVSLFYPRCCLACNQGLAKGEETVCSTCMLELPRTEYHTNAGNALFRRLEGRVPLQFAVAFFLFRKKGRVQQLMHQLKYNNHPEVGQVLGVVYGEELRQHNFDGKIDAIIPVPLHLSRKRKRGYNQSAEFGKGLSASLNRPCVEDVLVRIRKTETQTKKTRLMRWQNVNEVFHVAKPEVLHQKNVLLIDDVITTGATIEACAKMLLGAGCKSVSIASIAYTDEGK